METAEQTVEQPNSCEISVNAKGQYSGKIKVYAATLEEACEEARIKAAGLAMLIKLKNNSETGK